MTLSNKVFLNNKSLIGLLEIKPVGFLFFKLPLAFFSVKWIMYRCYHIKRAFPSFLYSHNILKLERDGYYNTQLFEKFFSWLLGRPRNGAHWKFSCFFSSLCFMRIWLFLRCLNAAALLFNSCSKFRWWELSPVPELVLYADCGFCCLWVVCTFVLNIRCRFSVPLHSCT